MSRLATLPTVADDVAMDDAGDKPLREVASDHMSSEQSRLKSVKHGAADSVRGMADETPAHSTGFVSDTAADQDDIPVSTARTSAVTGPMVTTWLVRLGALACGLIAWHLLTAYNVKYYINFENVPEPLTVWRAFTAQLGGSEFYIHVLVSMKRILIGYAIASALGIALGLIMGRSRLFHDLFMPYIEILRPIPAVAWIPLAILMWPTEEASIIYITFLGALFPIVLNTMHGVEQTPEVLVRAARSLGARRLQIFRHVVLPAALPSIATGLAVGMGVSWFSLLAGEIISGQYGIGYFTWNAYSLINYPDIVVGMLCIGLLGTASTHAVRMLTRPFLKWQERTR